MSSNTAVANVVLAVAILWAGSSIYGHYTEMRAEIARAESKAKETEAMFQALQNAAQAAARTNQEALALAIERLAEGRE